MDDFDWGDFDIDYSGGTDALFDFNIDPSTLGGIDFGSMLDNLAFDFDIDPATLGGLESFDSALNQAAMNFDVDPSTLGGVDYFDRTFDFGSGRVDISNLLEQGARINPEGDLVFTNPDGTRVTYTKEGMIRTEDPGGRNVFYHTTDGRNYVVDYENLEPGSVVQTYGQDVGGGPTRFVTYRGTGDDATVADYSDMKKGATVTTSGPGGTTTTTKAGDTGGTTKIIDTKTGDVTKTYDNDTGNVLTTGQQIVKTLADAVGGKTNLGLLAGLLGGLAGLKSGSGGGGGRGVGYQGGIPEYKVTRGPARSPTEGGRRPGAAGIGSLTGGVTFTPTGNVMGLPGSSTAGGITLSPEEEERIRQYTQKAAGGGLMGLSAGGRPARYLAGGTDGMADKIQTDIDGKQPARLSHGEFVIPADVVSHLGNGNSDAGSKVLYDMMAKIRKARTGTEKQGRQINPNKFMPGKGR